MKNFIYKAIKADGSVVEGERTAEGKEDLTLALREDGLTVVFIEESGRAGLSKQLQFSFGSVGAQDKIVFARNMGKMISAGLSVVRSLEIIERQQKSKKFQRIIREVREEVNKGTTLAESMHMHSDVFDSLMVAMVKAGEESGNLSDSLQVVSGQMEEAHNLKKRIRGAMIYPAVILTAMVVIGVLLLIFVVPTLQDTFSGLDIELPLATRVLIGSSDFLRANAILSLFSAVAVFALIGLYLRSKPGRRFMDTVVLKLPVIKGIAKQINAARTARTLSSLLKSGVEFTVAIQITEDVLQNSYYKKVMHDAQEYVVKGGNISEVFSEHDKIYPFFVAEMAAVGEETGKISEMLLEVALYYEEEVSRRTKDLSTIIEPVLMIVIGTGVAFFALSVLSPIYSLAENI